MIWKYVSWISFTVVISFDSINGNNSLACNFLDSINITSDHLPTDYSKPIIFNDTTYGPYDYAVFDYELDRQMKKVPVEPHLRGCYCKYKSCIRICCPNGHEYNFERELCKQIPDVNYSRSIKLTMLNEKDEYETVSAIDRFNVIYREPHCKTPLVRSNYTIDYMGNAIVGTTSIQHINYCIYVDPKTNKQRLWYCDGHPDEDLFQEVLGWCMLISVPFMIATIFVYRIVDKLRNLHGKCFIAYLIAMKFAFLTTAFIKLSNNTGSIGCHTTAWIMYFSYFSAFLWLNVICFDLWSNIRKTNGCQKFPDDRMFNNYFIYAVGISFAFTAFTMIMNYTEILPVSWRPGIQFDMCFIRGKFANGLYFYGPLAIILGINVVLFILTAIRIRQLQNRMRLSSFKQPSKKCLHAFRSNVEKCALYLQLFVVMGISWIMEVVSFFAETFSHTKICKFFECINVLQGVLIFALLVLAPRAQKLIKKWCQKTQPSISETNETNQFTLKHIY